MFRLGKYIEQAGRGFNIIACAAVIVMMLLSTADVVLRMLGKPIPGAYELVGFMGTVVVSFSLGFTTLEKGHIAVELLFRKLPQRVQLGMETFTNFTGILLFGMIAYQAFAYALDIRKSGEVSATLQMPVYPFIFGMALGFGLLCVILMADCLKSLKRAISG
jgi:TRAP-type C4-dicarboxylate transport system permease small subunit